MVPWLGFSKLKEAGDGNGASHGDAWISDTSKRWTNAPDMPSSQSPPRNFMTFQNPVSMRGTNPECQVSVT